MTAFPSPANELDSGAAEAAVSHIGLAPSRFRSPARSGPCASWDQKTFSEESCASRQPSPLIFLCPDDTWHICFSTKVCTICKCK